MLSIQNLNFSYKKGNLLLKDLSFSTGSGEILTILGPNGAGKTTLLRCLNAMLKPSSGKVVVEKWNIFQMKAAEIARQIGYVPQQNEAGRLSVFDAVLLGRIPYLKWRAAKEDLSKVDSILCQLHLEKSALRNIDELSGGELQKVCIARALVQEPRLLILDEPTSNLDLKNQLDILKIMRKVVAEHKVTVVTAIHDLNLAFRFMDRFLFIKNGRVYAAGHLHEINPEMIAAVYNVKVDIINHKGNFCVIPENFNKI